MMIKYNSTKIQYNFTKTKKMKLMKKIYNIKKELRN